jgi:hypothetical protein
VGDCCDNEAYSIPSGWCGFTVNGYQWTDANGIGNNQAANHFYMNHVCNDDRTAYYTEGGTPAIFDSTGGTNIQRVMQLYRFYGSSPGTYIHIAKEYDPTSFLLLGLPTGGVLGADDSPSDLRCSGGPGPCSNQSLLHTTRKWPMITYATGTQLPEHGDPVLCTFIFAGDKGDVGAQGPQGNQGIEGGTEIELGINVYSSSGFTSDDINETQPVGIRRLPFSGYIKNFEFVRDGARNNHWTLAWWKPSLHGETEAGFETPKVIQGFAHVPPYVVAYEQGNESEYMGSSNPDWYQVTGGQNFSGTSGSAGNGGMDNDSRWLTGYWPTGSFPSGSYLCFFLTGVDAGTDTHLNSLNITFKKYGPTLGGG